MLYCLLAITTALATLNLVFLAWYFFAPPHINDERAVLPLELPQRTPLPPPPLPPPPILTPVVPVVPVEPAKSGIDVELMLQFMQMVQQTAQITAQSTAQAVSAAVAPTQLPTERDPYLIAQDVVNKFMQQQELQQEQLDYTDPTDDTVPAPTRQDHLVTIGSGPISGFGAGSNAGSNGKVRGISPLFGIGVDK